MIKKDLIITVLATFCITATLFMIIPTKSQQPYDPWLDTNDDGIIDIADIYVAALAFGTWGDPTKNVTITGHANKIITLAENVIVPTNSSWDSSWVFVDGYSKMTVCIRYTVYSIYYYPPENEYFLYVGHSGGEESFIADDALDFGYLVKTYDVMNEWVWISIKNSRYDFDGSIWVDVYLIP